MRKRRNHLWWFVLLAGLPAGCGVNWNRSFEGGMQQAAAGRRRALVEFYAAVSPVCRQMDDEVFSEPEVQATMEGFVPIRLDLYLDQQWADQYSVTEAPTFLVLRPDGSVAGTATGFMDAETFRVFLIKHRYN